MPDDQVTTAEVVNPPAPTKGRRLLNRWVVVVLALIAVDVLAFIVAPPFPKGGHPGDACSFPVCFIESSLEFPAPHTVVDLDPANAPAADALVTFHPAISNTLLTMWIVMAIVIVGFLIGAGSGTVMIYRLVSRFLKTIDERPG